MNPEPPEIENLATPRALVVRVHAADMDAPLAVRLVQAVFDGFPGDPRPVVLNLSEVSRANSTAAAAIYRIAAARECWLVGLQPRVASVLEMLGFLAVARQAPDEAEAARAIGSGRTGGPG